MKMLFRNVDMRTTDGPFQLAPETFKAVGGTTPGLVDMDLHALTKKG